MPFIPIDLTSFNNTPANQTPFTSIQDAIMKARQFELQKEKMRAEILQSQAQTKNLADDNVRSDEYLKIQQGNASRANKTQDATDLNTLYTAAADDPAHAAQIAQALGYKQKPQPQANAVDEILAGPQVQGTGGAGLPQDIFGPPEGAAHPDDYGNMMPPTAPQMDMGPRPEAQSQLAAQGRVAAAAPSSRMQFEGPGGRMIEIDPEQAANTHRRQLDEDIEKRTAASGMNVLARSQAAEAKRTFDAEQAALYKNQGMTVGDRKDIARINANARLGAASISANPEGKADTGNRQDLALLERKMTNLDRTVNWKSLVAGDQALRGAMQNINSGNPQLELDAQMQLARFFRGTVTEGEMRYLNQHLGGVVEKIPGFLEALNRGGLTRKQKQIVAESAATAHHEWETNRDRTFGAMKDALGPDAGLQNIASAVNAQVRARAKMAGAEVPDVYPDAQPATVLGSGERPKAVAARKAAPTDKGRAARLQNAPAVQWVTTNENSPDPATREKALKMKTRLQAMGAM